MQLERILSVEKEGVNTDRNGKKSKKGKSAITYNVESYIKYKLMYTLIKKMKHSNYLIKNQVMEWDFKYICFMC